MKPTKLSLFEIFERQRVYTVPLYQRPYVWSLHKHWVPLWRDIRDKACLVLHHKAQAAPQQTVKPHFFGAVVFEQVPVFGRQLFNASVIDGQQRLTTSQVFLAAFRDIVQEAGLASLHEDLLTLTANTGKRELPHERYKLWPTNLDRPAFEAVMNAGSPSTLLTVYPFKRIGRTKRFEPRPPLVEAYEFFHQAIRYFDTEDADAAEPTPVSETSLNAIYDVVKQHLQLVVIDLEKDDDPQVIFESLNGRSEALLPSDLIRNFVFLQAKSENESADKLYDDFWREFDERPDPEADPKSGDRFWRRTQTVGRVGRRRLDLFIEHYLEYRTGQDVNIGLLFSEFRDWWLRQSRSVCEELAALRAHSDVYASFLLPKTDTRLGQFAERLNVLDTTTAYPLLLHLVADPKGRLAGDDLTAAVTDLDSYLVRRMICGHSTAAYNRIFLQLLKKLRAPDACAPREVIRTHLLSGTGPSERWPDDEELTRAWLCDPVYKTIKQRRVNMVLTALERRLRTPKQETQVPPTGLSVEHVMPQKWETNWSLPAAESDQPPVSTAEERGRLLHTFGNLTLVTQPLNSALSNGAFPAKRDEIKKSLLCLNTYFHSLAEWDEAAIQKRAVALLEVAKTVWPHPNKPAPLASLPVPANA